MLSDLIELMIIFSQNVSMINKNISDREIRYMNIACEILRRAHETTAGFLIDIYEKINNVI